MKVAVVIDTWFPAIGGGQVNALEISKRISSKKYKIDIITRNQGKFNEKQFKNLKIYRIGKISKPLDNISRLYFLYKTFFLIKKENYDLVHLHAFLPGLLSPLIRSFLRKPVIFTVHGTRMFEENPVPSFGFWLEKFILTKIKYNAQISVTKAFMKYRNVNKDIFYVPNGIDLEKFKKENVKKTKYPKILWVGRFDPVKRVDLLILAMKTINEKIPNARLSLIGYGQEEDKLKDLVKKLKIKNIQFVGKKHGKDLVKEYKSSHVFVLPSNSEGQPLVLLEAQAAGLSIVATKVGGVEEIIDDKKSGILVEPNDCKKLTDAIIKALKNYKLYSLKGHESIYKSNDWAFIASKTLSVYGIILNNSKV